MALGKSRDDLETALLLGLDDEFSAALHQVKQRYMKGTWNGDGWQDEMIKLMAFELCGVLGKRLDSLPKGKYILN